MLPPIMAETDVANFSSLVQTLTGMHSFSPERCWATVDEPRSSKKAKVSSLIPTTTADSHAACSTESRSNHELVSKAVVKHQDAQLTPLETESDASLVTHTFTDDVVSSCTDATADATSMLGVDDIFTIEELELSPYNLFSASSSMFTVCNDLLQDEAICSLQQSRLFWLDQSCDPFSELEFLQ